MRLRETPYAVLAGCALSLLAPTVARADVKAECAAAYERADPLRKSGKLIEAQRAVLACAQEACTDWVKAQCVTWLGELHASLPTVVFAVRDASGADTLSVRVSVDGQPFAERLDGKALAMDPGSHKLRFEIPGAEPLEQDIVILQGAKDRRVEVSFKKTDERLTTTPTELRPLAATPAPDASIPTSRAVVPTWAWVTGGLGLTAMVAGGVMVGVGTKFAGDCSHANSCSLPPAALQAPGGVLLGLGVIAAGIGIFGVATAPQGSAGAVPMALRWSPWIGARTGGLSAGGSF